MSAERGGTGRGRAERWLRPSVALPALAVVLVLAILWTPEVNQIDTDPRLTTFSTSPRAAQGFYEVASRLGWRTRRLRIPFHAPLDTDVVYAVLDPPEGLSIAETQMLLHAVRHGAGLVYVAGTGTALDDSLKMRHSDSGYAPSATDAVAPTRCPTEHGVNAIPWFANGVRLYRLVAPRALPVDTVVFMSVDVPTASMFTNHAPALLGMPLGRGRVVVASDPDLLRNDVVRVCRWGIGQRDVAALDWVSRGERPRLVFDEYHQGFGSHPGPWPTIGQFLVATPEGRVIAQAVLAALVLLLALGPRAIAPQGVERIERRSPLEHVGALARAYEQIAATRVAARRLARGLRRRHGRGAWSARGDALARSGDADERFLGAVATSHPEVATDTVRLLAAERRSVSAIGLLAVADSVDRIDEVFSPPTS